VCVCVYIHIYIYMYVCMYVCVCIYIYIYMYSFYFLLHKIFGAMPDDGVLRQKYSIPCYTINTELRCWNVFVINYV